MKHATRSTAHNAAKFVLIGLSGTLFAVLISCVNPKPDAMTAKPAPPPPPPTFRQAVSDYYSGYFDRSIQMFERLVSEHPENTKARWELVREFEESGDYNAAISELISRYGIDHDTSKIDNELFIARVLSANYSSAHYMMPLTAPTPETVFFQGYMEMRLGNSGAAKQLFHRSIDMHHHQPMAWFFIGTLDYESKDYAAAQSAFETVRKQNPDITIAIPPLARSILAQGREREAYPLLLQARAILPNNASIKEEIARLERQHPGLVEKHSAQNTLRQRYTLPPQVSTFPPKGASTTEIRVGLAEDLHALTIKPGGGFRIETLHGSTGVIYHGTGDEVLKLVQTPTGIELSHPDSRPFLSWNVPVVLSYDKPEDTTVLFNLVSESGSFFATSSDRAYRGEIILRPGSKGFTVVNRLPLEEYLYAVLPSEMYSFWPAEALKAQAVAARSYTLASMGTYSSKGFDLYGSVRSAAYQGVTNESPLTTQAVNATQGEVLAYKGKPLKAYYSANSGGYTEDSRVVWGEDDGMAAVADLLGKKRNSYLSLEALQSWLTSRPASYSATPPFYSASSYRWTKWVSAAEIERRANRVKKIGKLVEIISLGRGISGRIDKLELFGVDGSLIVRGDRIRGILGDLRSNLFTFRPVIGKGGNPDYFIFTGGGWGHGVGMDQDGAAGMASAGYTYKQILSHYYPRATLESINAMREDSSPSRGK